MNRQDLNKIVQGLTFTLSIPDIVCVVIKRYRSEHRNKGLLIFFMDRCDLIIKRYRGQAKLTP